MKATHALIKILFFSFVLTSSNLIAAPSNQSSMGLPLSDIQRFATTIAQIKRYYIEPVENEKLFTYAIEGMLNNLDPHSSYLNKDDLEDLTSATTGKFGGIGIEVVPYQGVIKVVSPIDGTPAYKAGIKAGDLIVRINNKIVKDMTIREAIDLIRGEPGSEVKLTLFREGTTQPITADVKREIIKIDTVKSKMLEDGYGYIRIALFQTPTQRDVIKAIEQLKKTSNNHLKGVIIDLRNNPGGLLDSAVDISNLFLGKKYLKDNDLIVYTEGRIKSADVKAHAQGKDILNGIPLIVLINSGSASASEIVAGALQDHNRALIVGTKSFGKGSVQTVLPIDKDSAIKLTTALYYTPKGRSIQALGIEPDVIVQAVNIPKEKTEALLFDNIGEADLDRHLENGQKKAAEKKREQDAANAKIEKELMQTDFQLYQALNLIKAMNRFEAVS